MSENNKANWFAQQPTEPGFYWYYGRLCGKTDKEPELISIQVMNKSLIFMRSGFLWDYEPLDGLFCRAIMPEAPFLPLKTKTPDEKKP